MNTDTHDTLHVAYRYLAIGGWSIALVYLFYTAIVDYRNRPGRSWARERRHRTDRKRPETSSQERDG